MKTDFRKVTPLADESTSHLSGNQDLKAFASNSEIKDLMSTIQDEGVKRI